MSQHTQHGLTPREPGPAEKRPVLRIGATIGSILLLVVALGFAHKADLKAEAEDAAINQAIADKLTQKARDDMWAGRMADAYAQGRRDALEVGYGTPEEARLVAVCREVRGARQ